MQKNYALRITNYELFIKNYALRITNYELFITFGEGKMRLNKKINEFILYCLRLLLPLQPLLRDDSMKFNNLTTKI